MYGQSEKGKEGDDNGKNLHHLAFTFLSIDCPAAVPIRAIGSVSAAFDRLAVADNLEYHAEMEDENEQ